MHISDTKIVAVSDDQLRAIVSDLFARQECHPISRVVVQERPDIVFARKDGAPLVRADMFDVFKCIQDIYKRNHY